MVCRTAFAPGGAVMRAIIEISPPLAKRHTMTERKLKAVPSSVEVAAKDKHLL
jgi:hypothetical protein